MSLGKLIIPTTLLMVFGLIILARLGIFSLTPVIILLGVFVVAASTKEMKYGTLIGVLTAVSVILPLGIVFIILFILGLIDLVTLLLFLPFLDWTGSLLELFGTSLFLSILLSPFIGALGGLTGQLLISNEEDKKSKTPRILSGFEGLTRIPPPIKNVHFCPVCDTPNELNAQFCNNCGAHLNKT